MNDKNDINLLRDSEGELLEVSSRMRTMRSSVRPVITYAFTFAYIFLAFYGAFNKLIDFKDLLMMFGSNCGIIIGWWFAERLAAAKYTQSNTG